MKNELDDRLRAGARREVREAPAGLPARVLARLGEREEARERPGRRLALLFPLGLAAAAALAFVFWPRPAAEAPAAARPPLLSMDLPERGIQFAARIDRPLADEWERMVRNSLQLYDALAGQLPTLPR